MVGGDSCGGWRPPGADDVLATVAGRMLAEPRLDDDAPVVAGDGGAIAAANEVAGVTTDSS